MAVSVICPGCRTSYPVTEDLLGKKIRCKKCQESFTAALSKSKAGARNADERIQTKPSSRDRYDDEDDYEDSPRRNGNGRGNPARKPQAAKGGNGLLIGGIVFGAVLLLGGGALGVWMMNRESDPDTPTTPSVPVAVNNTGGTTGTVTEPSTAPKVDNTAQANAKPANQLRTADAPPPLDLKDPRHRPAEFKPDVVDRVKKSAVLIRVTSEEGLGYGSGWFAEKHGREAYIVTNSHVVGMKEPAKPPPEKIEIILDSGIEGKERTLIGTLLALDREEDLAVIRVKDSNLPDALPITPSFDLQESQKLLILGFPKGKFLEDELRQGLGVRVLTTLKARQSSVAGRILNKDGSVKYIQVEGGADPGNSGGAVVDTNGFVSAILVAGDPQSNMRWVIPSEYAIHLLRGRVLKVVAGQAVSSGSTIKQPMVAMIADPLRRLRSVHAEVFVGRKPDESKGEKSIRPAPAREPQAVEGDGQRITTTLNYDPNQQLQLGEAHTAAGELMLPPLNEKEVYWFQPHYFCKDGTQRWGEAIVLEMGRYPVEERPANLTAKYKPDRGPGDARQVELESRQVQSIEFEGAGGGSVDQGLKARLTEKTRSVEKNGDAKLRIQYVDLRLSDTEQDSQIRKQLRGVMESVKWLGAEVTITTDGRFVNPVPDFANVPQPARPILRRFNEQIIESLEAMSLGLPNKEVSPGETWSHDVHYSMNVGTGVQNAVFRLTCKYIGSRVRDGRDEAVVEVTGRMVGNQGGASGGAASTSRGGGGRGAPPSTNPDDGGGDADSSPYDADGNLKKGFYGMARGAAIVDLASGLVTLSRTESDMALIATATVRNPRNPMQEAQVKVHAALYLDVLLRRSIGKDAPKSIDPMSVLPNQPRIYNPLVGAGMPAATGIEPSTNSIPERNTFLDSDKFKKVKSATVLVRVSAADGGEEGSGWFAEPGIVVTNCHVVGMLSKTNRPPEKIEVVLNSGLPNQRILDGKLMSVDREDDLAIIQVTGDKLPEPLNVVTADSLYESQTLNVVGFPKGSGLASNLTEGLGSRDLMTTVKFRPTTVAGRVPKADHTIKLIQYEGGSDPGNSGGPVVDANGDVRCVHVAGIRAGPRGMSSMRFGIPGEYAIRMIKGYPLEVLPGRAYMDGSTPKQPVEVKFSDPLHRVKKVVLEYWVGNPGNPRKPSDKAPKPAASDGPRQSIDLTYNAKGQLATGEFVLPPIPAGRVCWMQPRFIDGTGAELWSRAILHDPDGPPVERKPATLAVKYKVNSSRNVEMTTLTNLHYTLLGEEQRVGTPFKVTFSEDVKLVSRQGTATIHLAYKDLVLDLTKIIPGLAEAPQQIQAAFASQLRPYLNLMRGVITIVDVKRDGRLQLRNVNYGQLPPQVQPQFAMFNQQVLSSLQALTFPMPGKEVPYGHTWDFPTDLFIVSKNKSEGAAFKMNFKYVGRRERSGREEAIIEITGSLKDNPNAKGISQVDMREEPTTPDPTPGGEPSPNPDREQYKPPSVGDTKGKKGLYGVAHGYAILDLKDNYIADVKLWIDLDVEMTAKEPTSKQEVPVVAGGTMELKLRRSTTQLVK